MSNLVQQIWSRIASINPDFLIKGVLPHWVIFMATLTAFTPFIVIHLFFENHPFFLRYKIHKDKPLKREDFKKKLKIWIKEHIMATVISPFVFYALFYRVVYSVDKLPTISTMAWQIAFIIFVEETLFYWIHRIMHKVPWLMQNIHRYHHLERYTDFLSTRMFHTADDIFGNFLPVVAGTVILSFITEVHLITFFVWSFIMMYETTIAHSGYDFPWTLVDARPHAFHHSHYCDNYGSFFLIWDKLLGTNSTYLSHLEPKKDKCSSN
jgi:sterol desaturase/sphingolipid hydroxylase (fatty acid hydroxylase superfamily)